MASNNPKQIVDYIVHLHNNENSNYDPYIEYLKGEFFTNTLPNKQYAICLLYILKILL